VYSMPPPLGPILDATRTNRRWRPSSSAEAPRTTRAKAANASEPGNALDRVEAGGSLGEVGNADQSDVAPLGEVD